MGKSGSKGLAKTSATCCTASTEKEHDSLGAGRAFAAMIERDPKTREAWERARAQLSLLAKLLPMVNDPVERARKRTFRALTKAMVEAKRAADRELEALGFAPPRTIEEWEHLAYLVEIPFETVRSGNLTLAEVHAVALAWAERQRLKAMLRSPSVSPTARARAEHPGGEAGANGASGGDGDGGGATRTNAIPPSCTHANDYSWVIWFGTRHAFAQGNQAQSVRVLWEHWERSGHKDGCGCSERAIGEQIGNDSDYFRLATVFRGHPAWGTMIKPMENRACFALFSPESQSTRT